MKSAIHSAFHYHLVTVFFLIPVKVKWEKSHDTLSILVLGNQKGCENSYSLFEFYIVLTVSDSEMVFCQRTNKKWEVKWRWRSEEQETKKI